MAKHCQTPSGWKLWAPTTCKSQNHLPRHQLVLILKQSLFARAQRNQSLNWAPGLSGSTHHSCQFREKPVLIHEGLIPTVIKNYTPLETVALWPNMARKEPCSAAQYTLKFTMALSFREPSTPQRSPALHCWTGTSLGCRLCGGKSSQEIS